MWGANANGQIGNNTLSDLQIPTQISSYGSIVSKNITFIACGESHTICLDSTGYLHAWGKNNYGQLGNNSLVKSQIPIQISTFGSLASKNMIAIKCGALHSIALDTTGSVHSWGYNGAGMLGNQSLTDSKIPILISSFGSLVSRTISSIACGGSHTVALDTTGSVHAWGYNFGGQVGNGTSTNVQTPIKVSYGSIVSKTIISIACGDSHTIALDSTGTIHAWGANDYGMLGTGAFTGQNIPVQISTGSIVSKTITSIACGSYHTIAIDSTGALHAWGRNSSGQIGDSTLFVVALPSKISTFGSIASKTVTSISCGYSHTLALDTTGTIHSWGENGNGQLGNGTLANTSIPTIVPNSTTFTNFTGQHRCFVASYSNNLSSIEGLIVCANTNKYNTTSVTLGGDSAFTTGLSAITINDSLPLVSLSQKENDKTVFGVVSLKPNIFPGTPEFNPVQLAKVGDLRAEINAVGEGAMWVSNIGGPLISGDYVTSSSLPGYGMVQHDEFLHNYTVAKATMSCDFDTSTTQPKLQRRIDTSGNNVLGDDGLPIFDPVLDASSNVILEPLFKSRLLDSSGNIIDKDVQEKLVAAGSNTYTAAFVGCTYHCG
jgi:alpha-tubulin suppressor-like RCC1 family protein